MYLRLYITVSVAVVLMVASVVTAKESDCSCEDGKLSTKTKTYVKTATASLAGALGTSALGSSFVGFTAIGIAKGSLAAYIQAKIGIGVVFSFLQSLGATGGLALGGPWGLGIAAVAGAATYFYSASGSDSCSCSNDTELSTEEDLTKLFSLKAIVSCVEPATSMTRMCSGRGLCDFDRDTEELDCKCSDEFSGTYCEIVKSSSTVSSELSRCGDKFLQTCTQCLIHLFTLDTPQKSCYEHCNWKNRNALVASLSTNEKRPDVGSLEMKRVLKMSVIEGTECTIPVNATCTTNIKYIYEHSDDHLDQLVVYYSSVEASCS